MAAVQVGQILALLGLALLVLGTMGRRRTRLRQAATGPFAGWWRWSDLCAYALILAGLFVMWMQK